MAGLFRGKCAASALAGWRLVRQKVERLDDSLRPHVVYYDSVRLNEEKNTRAARRGCYLSNPAFGKRTAWRRCFRLAGRGTDQLAAAHQMLSGARPVGSGVEGTERVSYG